MAQATEKVFLAVAPQNFASNGTPSGLVTIANTKLFRVKQRVQIQSSTEPTLTDIEVKFIASPTEMYVGPCIPAMNARSDLTSYLVADGATVSAKEQPRPNIPIDKQQIDAFEYEHEPIRAKRIYQVDDCGRPYNAGNPFPVLAQVASEGLAQTPNIINVPIPVADTEQSVALPLDTKQFSIGLRAGPGKVQFSFVNGASDTNYVTIKPGNKETFSDIKLTNTTIYFRCSKANAVLEILAWN